MYRSFSAFQIILFGFAMIILIGTLLLMTPAASSQATPCPPADALFTATSAVCVTGLVVRDTWQAWSGFGQAVILLLIQTGGMGVMLMICAAALITGRKIGLRERGTVQDSISAPHAGGVIRLARFILVLLFASEAVGAATLFPVFARDFGILRGLWFSVFHSISAMCNAGFDLLGCRGAYSSLASYAANPWVNLVIGGLIIWGGLGFLTWDDIFHRGGRLSRFRLQSRLILSMTLVLITIPLILFFLLEFREGPVNERLLHSFFSSVTPRTAGFATVDMNVFSEAGKMLIILLMLIGGAPGSTAGGMKVTTFGVIFLSVRSVLLREKDTNFHNRRIEESVIRNAVCICMMYLSLFLMAGCIISRIEGLPLLTCLFESASAVGTVGLTLGITPSLSIASKLILILLMFLGRVGGLTMVYAVIPQIRHGNARRITERVTVG